jgi:hypothetical protein
MTIRIIQIASLVIAAMLVAVVAVAAILYLVIDADDVVRFAQARIKAETGRELSVHGPAALKKGWRPRLRAESVSLSDAAWSADQSMLTAEAVELEVRLLSLLFRPLTVEEAILESPRLSILRNEKGVANWALGGGEFPRIVKIQVSDAQLRFEDRKDRRRFSLDLAEFVSAPRRDGKTATSAHGRLEGDRLSFTVVAEPWETLRRADAPFAVDLRLAVGEFRLAAKGSSADWLRLANFQADAEVAGPDLGALYKYTGLALPKTPPYEFRGRLVRDGAHWKFHEFRGALGKSPFEGEVAYDGGKAKPQFAGNVRSPALRLVDIAGLFGLDPARFDPDVEEKEESGPPPILSREPIPMARLNAMNADIQIAADVVEAKNAVFDEVGARVLVKEGVLRFAPFDFGSGGGRVRLRLAFDARGATPRADLDVAVENMPLSRIVGDRSLDEAVGPISGAVRLRAAGGSMKDLAGDAAGEAVLYMGGGKISHLLIEILGLDVAETLGVVLTEDEPIPVRCGVAHFAAKQGVLEAQSVFLDTTDTLVVAEGSIDLGAETAAIRLKPRPKDWSPFSLKTSIAVEGPLADLAIFPDPLKLGAEGVAKRAANAVVTTVVGLLPPIDIGEDRNVNCAAALASAKRAASPTH